MDAQLVLRVVGIVALAISVLFAALAVHYYLTRDIRGVMDDLSGKTRARGVAGVRRSAANDRKRETTRRSAASPVEATSEQPTTTAGALGVTPNAPVQTDAPGRSVPAQVDDEPETMVEADDVLDATGLPDGSVPQVVGMEVPGGSAPTATSHPTFHVTRRIVHMSATQVIAVSGGQR